MKNGYWDPTGDVACGNVDREYRVMVKLARKLFRERPGWAEDEKLKRRLGFTGIFSGVPDEVGKEMGAGK